MAVAGKWWAGAGLALLLGMSNGVAAESPVRMRVCAMDIDYAPFGKVDNTGHLQYLVQRAAKKVNITLDRHIAPRRRCLEEIKSGLSDGMASAYTPVRGETASFPMANGKIDASRAMGVMTYQVYRRSGSALEWDGKRFNQLGNGKIGVQSGFLYITERLVQLGVPYDDGAKGLDTMLSKLAAGRVDGVIGMREETDRLIAASYRGQMERSAKVFDQTPVYMMVSRQFYARHPALVERYWQAIRAYRSTDDYRHYQLTHP
jgi:polar amino acid transport system substrate-binding protein